MTEWAIKLPIRDPDEVVDVKAAGAHERSPRSNHAPTEPAPANRNSKPRRPRLASMNAHRPSNIGARLHSVSRRHERAR
jgi:hypothetical protein